MGLVQQYAQFVVKRAEEVSLQGDALVTDTKKLYEKSKEIVDLVRKLRNDLTDLEAYPLHINIELQQALRTFQAEYTTDRVEFDVRLEPNLPRIKCGSTDKVGRIFFDLIKNAFEALKNQEGTITLITRMIGSEVEVLIQDTGIGITPEDLKDIFEEWFSQKQTESDIGRGLGLYWAKRYLAAYGANIVPNSALGIGTTMTLRFQSWVDRKV